MQNLSAAKEVCVASGITEDDFYEAIKSFEGTSRRLQKLKETENGMIYLDFAHSPSKVKATVDAIVSRFPKREIVVCLELHTFSSLSMEFLPLYKGTMANAPNAFVYFNPHAIELKKLKHLSKETVLEAFGDEKIKVYDNSIEMFSHIKSQNYHNPVYLLMSSGDFDGFDINSLVK
jgi:UDP-N-acetylmuramate: L-alanyl-gamma-D-glutamyl-meso-diaminopimelate ligase